MLDKDDVLIILIIISKANTKIKTLLGYFNHD